MELSSNDDARTEAAVFQSMALLSAVRTASTVWQAVRERQAGRDPSEQEAEAVVRPFLSEAIAELEPMLLRLRTGLAYARSHDEPYLTALVRRFDDLMTLNRAMHLLQRVHQRLLSLYPTVSEELVEAFRHLYAETQTLLDTDEEAFPPRLDLFLEDSLVAVQSLREEVVGYGL